MWLRCGAALNPALDAASERPPEVDELLETLLGWLRDQPGDLQRVVLAERLVVKVQWAGPGEAALDALEEFTEIVASLDAHAIIELVDQMLSQTIWLAVAATSDDERRTRDEILRAIRRGRLPRGPQKTGTSEATLERQERLLRCLKDLEQLLAAIPGNRAAQLRAETMLGSLAALGALGRPKKQLALFDQLVALQQTAVAACDALVERTKERDSPSFFRKTCPLLKASLLILNGHTDPGRAILQQTLREHGNSKDPLTQELLSRARDMLADL